ncbi:hypothetical protein [Streptomyces violascens]|uniref:hypothetical protein n=1 Tax=Streptomyces violascens TaxID=67381 RepID=UPI003660D337
MAAQAAVAQYLTEAARACPDALQAVADALTRADDILDGNAEAIASAWLGDHARRLTD